MAKKVNVDVEELDNLLEEYASVTKKERVEKKEDAPKVKIKYVEKEVRKISWITIVSLIVNALLVIPIIFLATNLSEKNEIIDEQNIEIDNMSYYKYDSETLEDLLDGKTSYYIQDKLDFMDEFIVFEIEGFGKYYYTYDCMMEKVEGDYSFIAYNINEAQRLGLRKGSCR